MKQIICVLLILCLFPVCVTAESIDLSGLSFDELRELQTRISKELVTRPEWKEVPVPPGLYQVGVDIPAGNWDLRCGKAEYDGVHIVYGAKANASGTKVEGKTEWYGTLYKPNSEGKRENISINMIDGYFLEIQFGEVVFSVPERVDLGF